MAAIVMAVMLITIKTNIITIITMMAAATAAVRTTAAEAVAMVFGQENISIMAMIIIRDHNILVVTIINLAVIVAMHQFTATMHKHQM